MNDVIIGNATSGTPSSSPSPTPSPTPMMAGGDDDETPSTPKITPRRPNQSAVSGAGMAFA